MPITRVFRVRINTSMRQEFQEKFCSVSVQTVNKAPGFISVTIFKPSKWTPDEYAMISEWENEAALKKFAGDQWEHPIIPTGMDKFVIECWVHHYESWS
jgi:heme oxygenase (mycobilin-producing)